MAGTDSQKPAQWDADGPAFILVRPQMGENIGAAARGMWNFGLRALRLVAPRDGWPNPRAVAMASGAGGLLDEARLFEGVAEACADCHMVYATTARPRELVKPVFSPAEAAADMRDRIARGERVGVLFGPERTGLEAADLSPANAIVTFPTNPAFSSLNLGQSVLLSAYEWRRAGRPARADDAPPQASSAEVGMMLDHLAAELDAAHYFWPDHKARALRDSLDNIFRRAPLTEQDVRTLRGVIRALAEGPKRKRQKRGEAG